MLRDRDTGQILKVGKTEVLTIEASRLDKYSLAIEKSGRNVDMEMWTVPNQAGTTFESVEKSVRARLEAEGHTLPWDQGSYSRRPRLGREGPGVPFSPLPRRLKERGWRWREDGVLVDKNGIPV